MHSLIYKYSLWLTILTTNKGERKPGKKGISLSLEEWKKVVENMDKIEKAIKAAGGDSDSDSDD